MKWKARNDKMTEKREDGDFGAKRSREEDEDESMIASSLHEV